MSINSNLINVFSIVNQQINIEHYKIILHQCQLAPSRCSPKFFHLIMAHYFTPREASPVAEFDGEPNASGIPLQPLTSSSKCQALCQGSLEAAEV